MRIKEILVRDVLGVREVRLTDLPGTVLFLGKNGAGKSSVLHAIQQVLFGNCYGQTGSKLLVKQLTRRGAQRGQVRLVIEVEGRDDDLIVDATICAGAGSSLEVTDTKHNPVLQGSPSEVRAALWALLGQDMRHAAVAAYPREHLAGDTLGALLADLNGTPLEHKTVLEWAGSRKDWLAQYAADQGVMLESLAAMRKLGDAAMSDRRKVKRDLAKAESDIEASSEYKAELPPYPVDLQGEEIHEDRRAGVYSGLEKRKKQRDALLEERGRCQAVGARAESSVDSLADRHQKAKEKADKTGTAVQKADARVRELTALKRDLHDRVSNARGMLDLHKGERDRLTARMAKYENGCPTCGQALDGEARERVTGQTQHRLDQLDELIEVKEIEAGEAADRLEQTKADDVTAAAALDEARKAHGLAQTAAMRAEAELKAAQRGTGGRPLADVEAELAEADGAIARYEEALAALDARAEAERKAAGWAEALKRDRARVAKLTAELEAIEWCVAAFRQDGQAEHDLCAGGRDTFEETTNELLAPLGLKVQLSGSGEALELLLDDQPVRHWSAGELTAVQAALIRGFANGGLGIIDNLDALDQGRKGALMGLRDQLNTGTLLLAGAWGLSQDCDPEAIEAALPGTRVVWVEDGRAGG